MNLQYIEKLSKQEKKSTLERVVKLTEEAGELAQEVLVAHKASGTERKSEGADGILGECVDVVLVALSIFFANGGTQEELAARIEKKCTKWEKFQQK